MMGWASFLAAVPWIQAFIWAFKPTDIVDIRRFPPEERQAIDEMIARLRGTAAPGEAKAPGVQYREAMKEAKKDVTPPEGGDK